MKDTTCEVCDGRGYTATGALSEPCANCAGTGDRTAIECDCGEIVYCTGFTNTCECGADYNWNGVRLASREFWGEETGESFADIHSPRDPESLGWPYDELDW